MALVSRDRRRIAGLACAVSLVLAVSACGGGSTKGTAATSGGKDPKAFTLLTNAENTTVPGELKKLAAGACAAQNAALPLQVDTVPQASLDQKLQLLAGQGALPAMFPAGNAPATTKTLAQAGDLVDLQAELTKLGVIDDVQPSAVSTIKALYGGFVALPTEYNIEGIFYNKKIFTQQGISVPQTWDDLVAAAAKLQGAGVQPFSASGQQGWPLTRLISGYIYRDLGPDAMSAVASGSAKLTDPQYVKGAQAIADLGAKGYFGKGVGSIDYDTAVNTFLTGKAAMLYMGSWVLANVADPKADTIGADNVALMPFPTVTGGKGTIDQYPSNVGLPFTIGSKTYGPKVAAWVKCIAQNYGTGVLKDYGTISGFKVTTPVAGQSTLATDVQTTIANSTQSVLWFEAQFSTKATTVSQQDAAPLVSSSMSANSFMSAVQAAQAG